MTSLMVFNLIPHLYSHASHYAVVFKLNTTFVPTGISLCSKIDVYPRHLFMGQNSSRFNRMHLYFAYKMLNFTHVSCNLPVIPFPIGGNCFISTLC